MQWLQTLVGRLRGAGVGDITVRLDKGFFSQKIVRALEELGVSFVLKIPRHGWLSGYRGPWRYSAKGEAIFPGEKLWSATGSLWGARLLTIQTRKPVETEEGMLELDTYEVHHQADVLTNIPGIHAPTAWRRYNNGAVVEQRIEELAQLSAGKTAVDDLGGNALLWSLAAVETLHTLRQHFLSGSLADGPAEAAPPLAAPASREADYPWTQDLPAVASRRTRPPPPPHCAPGTEPRHPAPGARLSPAAAPHAMQVATVIVAPVSPAASRSPQVSSSQPCHDPQSLMPQLPRPFSTHSALAHAKNRPQRPPSQDPG